MLPLYAAKGGNANTDLYLVDPSTAALTNIGPVGFALTGLAFSPVTGLLYGVTSNNSPSNPRSLLSVNPTTGAGTYIGYLGTSGATNDIAFNELGVLYGWNSTGLPHLVTINLSTGVATTVGASGLSSSFGNGFDFHQVTQVIWGVFNGTTQDLYTVSASTGLATINIPIVGSGNGFAFSAGSFSAENNLLYGFETRPPNQTNSTLVTIDVLTGNFVDIGNMPTGVAFDAIAWERPPAITSFDIEMHA